MLDRHTKKVLKKKELKALRRALRIIEANTLAALGDMESEAPPPEEEDGA